MIVLYGILTTPTRKSGPAILSDVRDLASYDACYVPSASPVWEPVNIAASQTAKLVI